MTKKTQMKLRKILTLVSCAVLLVCMTVVGTIAYLTSTTEAVNNTFTYGEIKGQRSFANRAGVNVLLYVGDEDVYLYSAMKGTRGFMETAFNGWCRSRGIDPETVSPPNPDAMTWFNEPVED